MRKVVRFRRRRGYGPNWIVLGVLLVAAIGWYTIAGGQRSSAPPASSDRFISVPAPSTSPRIISVPETRSLAVSASDVIDGDTVRVRGVTYRLVGFDTPETGRQARCAYERDLGNRATARLRELVRNASTVDLVEVRCSCRPGTHGTRACNFGRSCAILRIDGRDVGWTLIGEGLARSYVCGSTSCPPRQSWC